MPCRTMYCDSSVKFTVLRCIGLGIIVLRLAALVFLVNVFVLVVVSGLVNIPVPVGLYRVIDPIRFPFELDGILSRQCTRYAVTLSCQF